MASVIATAVYKFLFKCDDKIFSWEGETVNVTRGTEEEEVSAWCEGSHNASHETKKHKGYRGDAAWGPEVQEDNSQTSESEEEEQEEEEQQEEEWSRGCPAGEEDGPEVREGRRDRDRRGQGRQRLIQWEAEGRINRVSSS